VKVKLDQVAEVPGRHGPVVASLVPPSCTAEARPCDTGSRLFRLPDRNAARTWRKVSSTARGACCRKIEIEEAVGAQGVKGVKGVTGAHRPNRLHSGCAPTV